MSNWAKLKPTIAKQERKPISVKRPRNDAKDLVEAFNKTKNEEEITKTPVISTVPIFSAAVTADAIEMQAERNASLSILDQILQSAAPPSDDEDLTQTETSTQSITVSSVSKQKIGKYLAIDCEMVGVGPQGFESALARVSIVNFHGHTIMDKFVKPREYVTDYRTHVSGITAQLLVNAEEFDKVQAEVSDLIQDRVIVGHGLENDFKVLLMNHPRTSIRDTSNYTLFRTLNKGRKPSLKLLASSILGMEIQESSHDSVTDAAIAMLLYKRHRDEWEKSLGLGKNESEKAVEGGVKRMAVLTNNSSAIRKKKQKTNKKKVNRNKLTL